MKKFIPYEKLSKKEKRRFDQAKRQTWGSLNPITRKPPNSRAYCSGRAEIATLRSERNDQFCQREIANSPGW